MPSLPPVAMRSAHTVWILCFQDLTFSRCHCSRSHNHRCRPPTCPCLEYPYLEWTCLGCALPFVATHPHPSLPYLPRYDHDSHHQAYRKINWTSPIRQRCRSCRRRQGFSMRCCRCWCCCWTIPVNSMIIFIWVMAFYNSYMGEFVGFCVRGDLLFLPSL